MGKIHGSSDSHKAIHPSPPITRIRQTLRYQDPWPNPGQCFHKPKTHGSRSGPNQDAHPLIPNKSNLPNGRFFNLTTRQFQNIRTLTLTLTLKTKMPNNALSIKTRYLHKSSSFIRNICKITITLT